MGMTKSEANRLIAAGLMIESFSHDTLGSFNVTALRQLIANINPPIHYCRFADIRMVDGIECDAMAYLIGHREIDRQRCQELTSEQLDEPLIFLDCPPGSNGEPASQLLVDGIHRITVRHERGMEGFKYHLIPLAAAPRVPDKLFVEVPWGEMDLVPGKGLVKRRDALWSGRRKTKEPRPQDVDHERVIANADHFTAVAFRGTAGYARHEGVLKTIDEARVAAAKLYTNRPVMIYAVAHGLDGATDRVVHVENWSPTKPGLGQRGSRKGE